MENIKQLSSWLQSKKKQLIKTMLQSTVTSPFPSFNNVVKS